MPIFYSGNINSAHDIAQLRAWQPDLVISTNFSHYIGKGARSVARHGTWNLHKALLPMYRGMAPSFHALRDGSEMVGCTLHVVTRGFDTGDIIRQVEVPVRPDDTVYSLNRKTSDAGGRMLAELLVALDLNRIQATPQPAGDWKEHTYPSPSEFLIFGKNDCDSEAIQAMSFETFRRFTKVPTDLLADNAEAMAAISGADFDDRVDALRCERYLDNALPNRKAAPSPRSLVRAAYYRARPMLPVSVRKHLQRIALRGWEKIPFPKWPVDTTADDLMLAGWQALFSSTGRIPFPSSGSGRKDGRLRRS